MQRAISYRNTYFTTLAINRFINLFMDFPETNFIIIDSLNFIVEKLGARIFAFVIMRDHIHLIWEMPQNVLIDDLITSFKRFTGTKLVAYLKSLDNDYLLHFLSNRQDREYKIWKLTKGNIRIGGSEMLGVKMRYIHNNPTKDNYKSVNNCCDYYFSSANAYAKQSSNFRFLTVLNLPIVWHLEEGLF